MALILTPEEKRCYSNAFSEIRLKKKYNSPFRDDPDPSFEFYINNKSKRLWWKDWGTGETGNCYAFLDRWTGPITQREVKLIEKEKKPPPEIVTSEIISLDFWKQYGIKKTTLEKFNVKQVMSVNGFTHQKSFIYYLNNGRYKIYSPGAKVRFWGTMVKTDIFGIDQLPETGNLLVITKSLKDVMVLHEMGINAISYAAESVTPSKESINELRKRFKNIVLLYDNDKPGMDHSDRISKIHGLKKMFMKTAKDISDCVKETTLKKAETEFWEIFLKDEKEKNKYKFLQRETGDSELGLLKCAS